MYNNINMLDRIKKLFNKDSEIKPVKKERTYLNNTQILKAVQERMDKTNEKLDMISDNLSIISKYFEDLLKKREEDDNQKDMEKNINKILECGDDSDTKPNPFVDKNGKLVLYKFDIVVKYNIDDYPDFIYDKEEGLYAPSKDVLLDLYKTCDFDDVAVLRCYIEDKDSKGHDVKPEWIDSEEKIKKITSLPYRYSEEVCNTLTEKYEKYQEEIENECEDLNKKYNKETV